MTEPQPSRVRETDPLLQYARREGAHTETDSARNRECHTRNTKILLWGTGLLTMLGVILGVIIFAVARKNHDDFVFALQEEVTTRDIFKHLEAFQNIAKDHPSGSRSIANAYNASAEYVISTIIDAGVPCSPRKQYFDAPVWSQDQPGMLAVHYPTKSSYTSGQTPPEAQKMITVDYQEGVDFRSMRYGGLSANIGDATVISISNDGCAGSDFKIPTDRSGQVIALILAQENPSCTLFDSAYMAEQMGYAAVLFYNPANRTSLSNARVRIVEWKTGDPLVNIPVMSISNALGMMLLQFSESEKTQATVDLRVFHTLSVHRTFNVLCEIYTGLETISHRTQHIANSEPEYFQANDEDAHGLVIGAHLDSVPTGPGMVDNASGSSTILAILLAMKRLNFWGNHKVVFAWWGAEEVGLLGSRHYVQLLKKQGQIKKIGAALNFDMLGSPNYTPQIHSGESAPEDVRQASISLQKLFERSFIQDEKHFTLSDMYGGSDFLPFLNAGVPANGVLTGAGELKTEEERTKFGGIAGAPLDPCYHKACDTLENVSREAIEQMSRASAYVIATLLSVDNLWEFLNQGMN